MEKITKTFPGMKALDGVRFSLARGEVCALIGENGAGKSTLMKILAGEYQPDGGSILLEGREVRIDTPSHANRLGISMIHQELALIPELTIGQNIFLGCEPPSKIPFKIDWKRLYQDADRLLKRLNLPVAPQTLVADLSISQQQLVEVAKALSLRANIIVMDEPTSALTDSETQTLLQLIKELKSQGISIIYISHRMEEVYRIADSVTILRDGRLVGASSIKEITTDQIIHKMVGRDLKEICHVDRNMSGREILSVKSMRRGDQLKDLNFTLKRGEILGLAGLVGSGRSELARALFGIDRVDGGEVLMEGRLLKKRAPCHSVEAGLAFVPENRKEEGLFLNMSVEENITITILKEISRFLFLRHGKVRNIAESYLKKLSIKTANLRQKIQNLSGGNQQKVVIAKWLIRSPKVLILDEPTRGIDVGAKAEIYKLMFQLAESGIGIIMISSELPEILRMSDRILVMCEGKITANLKRQEATQDSIMKYAVGGAAT